ncbi:MAG: ribonuclease III [Nevskia sp.]|nr:ribonuclease III [Nevskia sp.]
MNLDPDRLQRALGYRFRDGAQLERALTHRSASHDNNERLEFLGDALLNFVIGEAVYLQLGGAAEGDLSRMRATLVREETLAVVARRIDLGESMRLGSGELKSGGYRRDSILADGLEAVIGAVYLDGGFGAARDLCLHLFGPELANLPDPGTLKDAKTRLQEHLQAVARPLPEYTVLDEAGPPHRRSFRVRCRLPDDGRETTGTGASRKFAEQQSAERMLQNLTGGEADHA